MKTKIKPPTVRKRGSVYQYDFRVDGERYQGSTGEKNEKRALEVAREEQARVIKRNITAGFDPYTATATEAFARFDQKKQFRGESTKANYELFKRRFFEFFGDVQLAALKDTEIEAWRDWLAEQKVDYSRPTLRGRVACKAPRGKKRNDYKAKKPKKTLGPKTINEHLTWLGSVYRILQLPNPVLLVEKMKITKVEKQEKLRFWTKEEIVKILEAAEEVLTTEGQEKSRSKGYDDHFFYACLRLLFFTGMRIGELEGIRLMDYNQEQGTLWVRLNKRYTGRNIPVEALSRKYKVEETDDFNTYDVHSAKEAVEDMIYFSKLHYQSQEKEMDPETRLYYKYDGWFEKTFKKLCERNEIEWKGTHGTRHSFVSNNLGKTKIEIIAKICGHADITETYRTYGHLIPQSVDEIIYDDQRDIWS